MDLSRFFAPDVQAAELSALTGALAATGRVTHGGGLRQHGAGWRADRNGPHCERIFGPLRADGCMCGRLRGPEHRGERCDRCGVEIGDPAVRATRWGHIACRVGVAHPTLISRAAATLGLGPRPLAWPDMPEDLDELDDDADEGVTFEELLDREDDLDEDAIEAPPPIAQPLDALEDRVGSSLRVHFVPVSPPTRRIGPPLSRGLLPTPTAEELAIGRLVAVCGRLDRLDELSAPPVILALAAQAAADALAALFVARSEPALSSIWTGRATRRPPVLTGHPPPERARDRHDTHVDGLAFWGDHLVITGRAGLRIVSLTTGRSRVVPAGPCHVLGVVGDVAVFDGLVAEAYAALNLKSGRWQRALPDAPRIRFGKDQPEDGWAEEVDTARIADLHVPSDRPAFGAYTPCLDALLVLGDDHGLLLDGHTGLPLLETNDRHDDAVPIEGGTRLVRVGWDQGRGGPPAIVWLGGRRWRVLLPAGGVGEIDETGSTVRWALRRAHTAAAFSPDGMKLAVAEGRSVRVLDSDGRLLRVIRG